LRFESRGQRGRRSLRGHLEAKLRRLVTVKGASCTNLRRGKLETGNVSFRFQFPFRTGVKKPRLKRTISNFRAVGTFSVLELGNWKVDHNESSQSEPSAAFPFSVPFPNFARNRSVSPRFRNQDANGSNSCIWPGCTRVLLHKARVIERWEASFGVPTHRVLSPSPAFARMRHEAWFSKVGQVTKLFGRLQNITPMRHNVA
jgi:hypothetical protein